MSLPFDRVVLQLDDGQQELSVDEFLALPVHKRVGYLLSRSLSFYLGKTEVDRREALTRLRAMNAPGQASADA